MQKQAPTIGRLLVMVGFALSCFGLLLFLWLAFGGAIPLKPKGYQFKRLVRRGARSWPRRPTSGSPACRSARSRRSSRPGDGPEHRDHPDRGALRADPQGHPGDPAPEDAAGRDLRRADAGQPAQPGRCPRAASCRRRRSPTPSSSTRSSAPSTSKTRRAFQTWMQRAVARRRRPRAATSPTRSATSSRSPTTPTSSSTCSTRRRTRSARLVRNTGEVFDARQRAARPAPGR